MERELVIRDLHEQIENLARLHRAHRERIRKYIAEHNIDVRKELDPMVGLLYRRYFD